MKLSRYLAAVVLIVGCTPSAHLSKNITHSLLHSEELEHAHVGISVYNATDNKTLYQYQSNKYFLPASNTKLFTCYAAMKYLGDSLPGILYAENDTAVLLVPTGDPTLLHRDYKSQPVINFLRNTHKNIYVVPGNWKEEALGFGWAWDDYNSDYMAERSPMPVYGNVIEWIQEKDQSSGSVNNSFENSTSIYSVPEVNWKIRFNPDSSSKSFFVLRSKDENVFQITQGNEERKEQDVPFVTFGLKSALELLPDTIHKEVKIWPHASMNGTFNAMDIRSQPLDSLLTPMMHRSDNFFAEQSLVMVSNQLLHFMSTSKVIDTLLKSDFKDLPDKPRWVDGSGLSRYNLFSPDDFVWLLQKMKNEFGMERLQRILPTGGTGTLSNFFKDERGVLFAKTGTLSGQVALSGFLYTKKNKLLIFSILVNNHNASAGAIRRQSESFLRSLRDQY